VPGRRACPLRERLREERIDACGADFHPFADLEQSVRKSVERIRRSPLLLRSKSRSWLRTSAVARSPNDADERVPGSSRVRYAWTTLSSIGISAGRFLCSAFVILEKPIPRMSANALKSRVSAIHGIELVASANEALGWTAQGASISPRRSKIAAISAAAMRAPPRFASLRSLSSNDAWPEESSAFSWNTPRGSGAPAQVDSRARHHDEE
jgi:hypothetical protein